MSSHRNLLELCIDGDLSKLIELYNTGIIDITDIRANNDILFKSACRFNYPMIAKWLESLCKDYEILDIHRHRGITYGIKRASIVNSYAFEKIAFEHECSVCLEFRGDCIITKCNHIFCNGCIIQWCKDHNQCPMCRSIIP